MTKTVVDTAYWALERYLDGRATRSDLYDLKDMLGKANSDKAQLYCYVGSQYITQSTVENYDTDVCWMIVAEDQSEALEMMWAHLEEHHPHFTAKTRILWKQNLIVPVRTDVEVEKGVRFMTIITHYE